MFDFKYQISILPTCSGVYIMKDKKNEIIYVGKAKNLKNRVSQYFQSGNNNSEKTKALVNNISEFEYIVTDNEIEALILENSLIKKHQPRYNILLKDDKTYSFIKITTNEDFPRIFSTKNYVKDGNTYFGPFIKGAGINDMINFVRATYFIRNCKISIREGKISCRPCLYYHMKKCKAPCYGLISIKEYNKDIKEAIYVLEGKGKKDLIKSLEEKMYSYSQNLEYEKAEAVLNKINGIKSIFETQKIFFQTNNSEDYINVFKDEKDACIQIFFLRQGQIVGREHFILESVYQEPIESIVEGFIKSFYGGTVAIPDNIYSPVFNDKEDICKWINLKGNKKVDFKTPKLGEKKELYDLVRKNAKITLEQFKKKIIIDNTLNKSELKELSNILGLDSELERIEAYDISNIQGFDSVGCMVVFNNGKPQNTQYRRFKIKNVKGSDDYKSMKEIVYRRFNNGINEIKEIQDNNLSYTKGKFCIFPDLILLDGGKGHVNTIENLLKEMNIDIPICGMVKDDKHKTRGLIYKNEELEISRSSKVMKFITRVQDEVHRYAITYHRSLRDRRGFSSILNEIPNIGEKRRRNLIMHFKDIDAIKKASFDEILNVYSMDKKSAMSIIDFFKKSNLK